MNLLHLKINAFLVTSKSIQKKPEYLDSFDAENSESESIAKELMDESESIPDDFDMDEAFEKYQKNTLQKENVEADEYIEPKPEASGQETAKKKVPQGKAYRY